MNPAFRLALCFLLIATVVVRAAEPSRPNILYILADDLGYGDVRAHWAESKISTPHLDRLAREGRIFSDAHSGSSVCTPTRYGILTGRYAWRSRLKNGVLGGLSPRLIEPGRLTVAEFLRQNGYSTACVGKWHLGLDWARHPGSSVNELGIENASQSKGVDFSQPITNGPLALGFDQFFGISASLDMVPYAFIENDRVTEVPDRESDFPWYHGRARRTRHGPAAASFDAVDVLPALAERACRFVAEQGKKKPFFLYVPLASPHTPIVPKPEWLGRSGISPYADFVMQTDAAVGALLDALDKHNLAGNTLVLFTSDNGCSPEADYPELARHGHDPSGPFRGHKADIFEGGHRVPFLARWPGRVPAGSRYDHPICLTDLFATCADILGKSLPETAAEDSVSLWPALQGRAEPVRADIVHHSINGSFAIRVGKWKLALCGDSGGWSDPKPAKAGTGPALQLYDLEADPAETKNLHEQHPEVVKELTAKLEELARRGRSTPGPDQSNTGEIRLRRMSLQ